MEIKRFVVIGGIDRYYYCGQSDSLKGAKLIAANALKRFGGWRDFQTPAIYSGKDCTVVWKEGFGGEREIAPIGCGRAKDGGCYVRPEYVNINGKWEVSR